jgi:integrative and conjugative element protein (TIGR02256 family)
MRNANRAQLDRSLFISCGAVSSMDKEVARYSFKETGGIFIGYKSEESIVITHATGPGPMAKHSLFNFERDVHFCNEELERLFYASDGALTYIGEWHTHPLGFLSPSKQDDKEMLEISRSPDYQNDEPLLAIAKQKGKGEGISIRCFLYSRRKRASLAFKVCNDVVGYR